MTFEEWLLGERRSPRRYISGLMLLTGIVLWLLAVVLTGTYWLVGLVFAGFWLGVVVGAISIVAAVAAIVFLWIAVHAPIA